MRSKEEMSVAGYGDFLGPAALAIADAYGDKQSKQYVTMLGSQSNRKALDLIALAAGTVGSHRVPMKYRDTARSAAAGAVFDLVSLYGTGFVHGTSTQGRVIEYDPVDTGAVATGPGSDEAGAAPADAYAMSASGSDW